MPPDKKYKPPKAILNNATPNYSNRKDKNDNIGTNSTKKWNSYNYLLINRIKLKKKSYMNKLKYSDSKEPKSQSWTSLPSKSSEKELSDKSDCANGTKTANL